MSLTALWGKEMKMEAPERLAVGVTKASVTVCPIGGVVPEEYIGQYILEAEVHKLVAEAVAAERKAHEKEIAVWSENYAALERRLADAEARGMERAMPTDQAIQDLSDHMWRVHPRELDEGGYVSKRFGGKYENPLAAWYADQIKALCRGSAIRAEAAAIRSAP